VPVGGQFDVLYFYSQILAGNKTVALETCNMLLSEIRDFYKFSSITESEPFPAFLNSSRDVAVLDREQISREMLCNKL